MPSRVQMVLRAIAGVPSEPSASLLDQTCAAAVNLLSLRGAGISLMVDGKLGGIAGVSDPGISEIQELQLELGEGPCLHAWATRAAVTEPNLADPAVHRWPLFARAAVGAGVAAVFAFPMRLGAIRIGVLVFYRDQVGELSAEETAQGLVFADVTTLIVLGLQAGALPGELHEALAAEPPHWAAIHQATGMVSAQLGVPLAEAFVRVRAHAFASERSLRDVSSDIVHGRLRLNEGL